MSNIGLWNGNQTNQGGQAPTPGNQAPGQEEFSSPKGQYDNLISLIKVFPMRPFTMAILLFAAVQLGTEMSSGRVSVDLIGWCVILYPALLILSLEELMFAKIAKIIKDTLIGIIKRAEENSKQL